MPRPGADGALVAEALHALAGSGVTIAEAVHNVPAAPGLYAVTGTPAAWEELNLGAPPDARPLYVGKAEASLNSRDVRTHFATGKTGWSTLRRSLAGLLAAQLDLHAQPRNPTRPGSYDRFGLEPRGDEALTEWMLDRLRLAVWPSPPGTHLGQIETAVLVTLSPPLNLSKVKSPCNRPVAEGRRRLAAQAKEWATPSRSTLEGP